MSPSRKRREIFSHPRSTVVPSSPLYYRSIPHYCAVCIAPFAIFAFPLSLFLSLFQTKFPKNVAISFFKYEKSVRDIKCSYKIQAHGRTFRERRRAIFQNRRWTEGIAPRSLSLSLPRSRFEFWNAQKSSRANDFGPFRETRRKKKERKKIRTKNRRPKLFCRPRASASCEFDSTTNAFSRTL